MSVSEKSKRVSGLKILDSILKNILNQNEMSHLSPEQAANQVKSLTNLIHNRSGIEGVLLIIKTNGDVYSMESEGIEGEALRKLADKVTDVAFQMEVQATISKQNNTL